MALMTVTDATFAEQVLANQLPVVVDVWAQWCPPCGPMLKVMAELAEELDGRVVIAKLNSDENPVTSRAYRVMSLPTLLLVNNGELVGTAVGARPKSVLRDLMLKQLPVTRDR